MPALAAGTGGAMVAALAVVLLLSRGSGIDDRLGSTLVEDHVRSLQASHLFDVASSNRHTVKPWFQGKLDFSPVVPDLASEGFPLVGGRLETIEGRPAAALVYRRAKHVINVFAFRREAVGGSEATSRDGFNVVAWRIGDLDYWAVSDVSAADLRRFAALFQAWEG